ncbi:E3 ubiquitin-protein ligase RHF1A-like [Bidens hawaiensis]|uniref:E3 ubiquitin-protein ligase RHF1A-like n=1 Tax=Bidens hawaiensis TaxID=980011 RepID=UPI004049B550
MDTTPSPLPLPQSTVGSIGVTVKDDDDRTCSEEDVCSICLDSFDSNHNPPTVTTCKHEFHLQCILEWSQRSEECPICWQVTVLKDPSSQELLSMVEDERRMRSAITVRHVYEDPEVDNDVEYVDPEFEEQVIRTLEASARSRHYSRRRNNHRHLGAGSSQTHSSVPRADASTGQEMYTSLEDFHSLGYASLQDNLAGSSSMSTSIDHTSPSAGSPISHVTYHTPENRVIDSQSPNGSPGRPISADMHAISESVKSKFSAASARYKESISKGTQGLKAKLLAKNSSVKELSKGVQREMSAGMAGVARIFERLDPTLKRNNDGTNLNFFKGKNTQNNSAETPTDVGSNGETMHL